MELIIKPNALRVGLQLTLLNSEWPKLYGVLAVLSAIGLTKTSDTDGEVKLIINPNALRVGLLLTLLNSEWPKLYGVFGHS